MGCLAHRGFGDIQMLFRSWDIVECLFGFAQFEIDSTILVKVTMRCGSCDQLGGNCCSRIEYLIRFGKASLFEQPHPFGVVLPRKPRNVCRASKLSLSAGEEADRLLLEL